MTVLLNNQEQVFELLEQSGAEQVQHYLKGLQASIAAISSDKVTRVIEMMFDATIKGNNIFICGNGGSAATANHMACDFGKGVRTPGFPSLRTISLSDSIPQLTAWANDNGYENCFSGQLEGLGRPGDLLIAISGSGNSPNVLKAVEMAKELNMFTIGFCGFKGGKLAGMVDHAIVIPGENIEQVEDCHMILDHVISTTSRFILQQYVRQQSQAQMVEQPA